jgi:hypothetical protein
MAANDQALDAGLAAAIAGKKPPSEEYLKHAGLASALTDPRDPSGNYGPLGQATRLLEYERQKRKLADPGYRAVIADWTGFFAASWNEWMGTEWNSVIYSHRHLLPVAAVAGWAQRNGQQELRVAANHWLGIFIRLASLISTPDGYWCGFGQRSGGHGTHPSAERATISVILAIASGEAGRVQRMTALAKAAGSAPAKNWAIAAASKLSAILQVAERGALPLGSGVRFAVPMYRLSNSRGEFAAWIARADGTCSDNNETPVVPAVVFTLAFGDLYAPEGGGAHFRSKGERCTIQYGDKALHYTSDKNKSCVLAIPDGCGALEVYGA